LLKPSAPMPSAPSFAHTTPVLVVDDTEMMGELITAMVRRIGFGTVNRVQDGMTALIMLRSKPYGLVISDLNMEPVSGLQLLRTIRSDSALRSLPFLMTTASLDVANAAAAKHAGVDTYLLKPFTPDLLRAKIGAAFRAARSRKHHGA
jgi:two-component system chemotaxis response regulator CheY